MMIDQPFVLSLVHWIPDDDTLCATKIGGSPPGPVSEVSLRQTSGRHRCQLTRS